MQFGQGRASTGVVFDSDFGNGVDDALALAMLYGLGGKSEARVIGLIVTKPNVKAAASCEAVARFYNGEPGPFGPGAISVGLTTQGKNAEETPLMGAILGKRTAEGKPAFPTDIQKMNDTADPVAVIRNALSAQTDGNAVVILAGPATNMAAALALPEFRELAQKKVKHLVMAAGAFPSGTEAAIKADIPAARKFLAEWPTPIFAVGTEVGAAITYPGSSIETDFAWAPSHPVVEAYRAWKPMPYDAPAAAPVAVLQAIRPQENYFKLSDPGVISVGEDGQTKFTPSADGKHRYLVVDPAQKDRVVEAMKELASAKPVPRAGRGPRPPVQKKQ